MEAYCMKCRKKTDMKEPQLIEQQTSRGLKKRYKGSCSVCGCGQSLMTK